MDPKSESRTSETAGSGGEARDLVVVRPFTLQKQDGEKVTYGVGTHKNVPSEICDHWYAQAHSLKEGEQPPDPLASAPVSERERAARVTAEEEAQRLRVISQRATDDCAAAQLEATQLREQLTVAETERDALRRQLEERDSASDEDDEEEPTSDDVRVHRKGRRWFVHRGQELVGEFPSKDAADAKAAELRGAAD